MRWTDAEGRGLEHCLLTLGPEGLTLEGVVAGTREGEYGAHYEVRTDASGRTRAVRLRYVGGPELQLTVDADARWRDAIRDVRLPDLDGCPQWELLLDTTDDGARERLAAGEETTLKARSVKLYRCVRD